MRRLLLAAVASVLALLVGETAAGADEHKSTVCHKEKNLSVANQAVPAHLAHGDSLGECGGGGKAL
ncbi:MAG: hypothetical protein ACT4PI_18685 [Actinomycetota bacterium]